MAIEKITDKYGRRFEVGRPFVFLAGVKVAGITRTGNYVTVRFGATVVRPAVPQPIVLHVDDVAATVER